MTAQLWGIMPKSFSVQQQQNTFMYISFMNIVSVSVEDQCAPTSSLKVATIFELFAHCHHTCV